METPNFNYLQKISKGDITFQNDILKIVKEELQEEIDNYHSYLKEKNYPKAKIYVHRIKHKMSILGLEKSYEITNCYENDLRQCNFKHREYFESMLPIMIDYLKTL